MKKRVDASSYTTSWDITAHCWSRTTRGRSGAFAASLARGSPPPRREMPVESWPPCATMKKRRRWSPLS